jgi:transcriptional regulator with XRE-family HTH domain
MAGEKATDSSTESRSSPVDAYVGSRICLRRVMLGLSQTRLAEALGITFQQVQKYERGVNRVSASRLFKISYVLDMPVSYFFDDMPDDMLEIPVSGPRGRTFGSPEWHEHFDGDSDVNLTRIETQKLLYYYYSIKNQAVQKCLFDLIKSIAA